MPKWCCRECVKRRTYQPSAARPSGKIVLRAIQTVDAVSVGSTTTDGLLSLSLNEIVRLEYLRDDGWWYGTSSSSHQKGWFPSTSVDFLPGFKLGISRCSQCFVLNPQLQKQLPGLRTTTKNSTSLAVRHTNKTIKTNTLPLLGPLAHHQHINPNPSFPTQSAYATALATTTKAAMTSLRPLSSPLKVQSFFGPQCQNLEILSLSPLLLKLEGFLDGPTCRSLIAAAYQRGFSAEESGCHGDEHHEHHEHHEQEHDHDHEHVVQQEGSSEKTNSGNTEQSTTAKIQGATPMETNASSTTVNTTTPTSSSDDNDEPMEQDRSNAERTSTACWLRKYDYESSHTTTEEPHMVAYEDRFAFVETEKKISNISNLPVSHQEPLQIVRYFPGQRFVPHMDWIDDYTKESYGGRVITVLIYLQAPKEGGSTTFPKLKKEVPPMMGTALFWYNCHPTDDVKNNVVVDERLLHAGEPVLAGEKIIAVTWVHPFDATELRER